MHVWYMLQRSSIQCMHVWFILQWSCTQRTHLWYILYNDPVYSVRMYDIYVTINQITWQLCRHKFSNKTAQGSKLSFTKMFEENWPALLLIVIHQSYETNASFLKQQIIDIWKKCRHFVFSFKFLYFRWIYTNELLKI